MYLIETKLAPSEIHGIGVFTVKDIMKGKTVWRKNPVVDIAIQKDSQAVVELPAFVRKHLEVHAEVSKDGKTWLIALDHDQYTNHSDTPNLVYREASGTFFAAEDIPAGTELTEDYTTFSYGDYDKELAKKESFA